MALQPGLNGRRIRVGGVTVYLVLEGQACHVPNPDTYDNLFENWEGLKEVGSLSDLDIDEGPALSASAGLLQQVDDAPVYFVSNQEKRWVTSPEVMDVYDFAWEKVQKVSATPIDAIPNGPNII